MRKPDSLDSVVPDLFDSIGGIERIARSMVSALGRRGSGLGAAGRRRVESEFLFESYERRVHAAMDELIA